MAAHELTSAWVRSGESESFPLLYHWRVLPEQPPRSEELKDREGAVAYWENSEALARRLEAEDKASASLVLFLENIPQTLWSWLNDRVSEGDVTAIECVERRLIKTLKFMNAHGLFHFDAHFQNILTDGQVIYLTDFGLAAANDFMLSPEERDFLRTHRSYDLRYAETCLVNRIVSRRFGAERCDAVLREYAERAGPVEGLDAVIRRYARVALIMREFIGKFRDETRLTPFPAEELARAVDEAG